MSYSQEQLEAAVREAEDRTKLAADETIKKLEEQLKQKSSALKSALATSLSETTRKDADIEKLKKEVGQINQDLEDQKDLVSRLKFELQSACEESMQALQRFSENAAAERAEANQREAKLLAERAELGDKIDEAEKAQRAAERKSEELQDSVDDLTRKLEDRERDVENMTREIEDLKSQLEKSESMRRQSAAAAQQPDNSLELKMQILDLQIELQNEREGKTELNVTLGREQHARADLERQVAELNKKIKEMEDTTTATSQDQNNQQHELTLQIDALAKELLEIRAQRSELQNALNEKTLLLAQCQTKTPDQQQTFEAPVKKVVVEVVGEGEKKKAGGFRVRSVVPIVGAALVGFAAARLSRK